MKKTTKFGLLLTAAAAAIAMTFTGCPEAPFGSDYFFGPWQTMDIQPDGSKKIYYKGTNNQYYRIVWNFNGKAENVSDGGVFRQHLYNYGTEEPTDFASDTNIYNETYWFGKYDIKGNSEYSRGKYFMNYQVGFDLDDAIAGGLYVADGTLAVSATNAIAKKGEGYRARADEIVAVLDNWQLADFLNFAYENENGLDNLKTDETLNNLAADYTGSHNKNGLNINIRYSDGGNGNTLLCNDISYFRFQLKEGNPLKASFTRMLASIYGPDGTTAIGKRYSQWKNEKTSLSSANMIEEGTSTWSGATTRCLGRISVNSTPDNPTWLCIEDAKTNQELFNLNDAGNSVDENDRTDYTDVNAEVEQ